MRQTPSGLEAAAAAAVVEVAEAGVAEAAVVDGEDGEAEAVDEAVTGIGTAAVVATPPLLPPSRDKLSVDPSH